MKRDMDLCRAILFAIEEEYVDTYEKFYIELLHSNISVKEPFEKVLPQ